MAKAFISYKHEVEPDEALADCFTKYLIKQGHQVFIDKQILIGQKWPPIIRQKIEEADCLVVLISNHSVASDMVIEEVSIAHSLKKIILPVYVEYEGNPPYDLASYLRGVQYKRFPQDGDESELSEQLNLAISQNQPLQGDVVCVQSDKVVALADDGNAVQPHVELAPPLPAFDPQWLQKLDVPGGPVRLKSSFYIGRPIDEEAKSAILREGETLRVKGSRQMGKTSLLARLYQLARDNNYPVLYIDFERADQHHFTDIGTLLLWLAYTIAGSQKTNEPPERYWKGPLGSKDKFTDFLSKEVLATSANPFVLMLDKVDRLFAFEYRDDFFSLVRSWHTNRAFDNTWDKLNVVLSYSTEAFLFIQDLDQSPFNVGVQVNVADFDRIKVEKLNKLHMEPVKTTQEIDALMELLGGHPFLVRKALYDLVIQHFHFDELIKKAYDDDGPFSDHLQRYMLHLDDQPHLRAAMKSVIYEHTSPTDALFYRLRSSGLVRGTDRHNVHPRCGLYAHYFKKHL